MLSIIDAGLSTTVNSPGLCPASLEMTQNGASLSDKHNEGFSVPQEKGKCYTWILIPFFPPVENFMFLRKMSLPFLQFTSLFLSYKQPKKWTALKQTPNKFSLISVA